MHKLDELLLQLQRREGSRPTTTELLCAAYLCGVKDATGFTVACLGDAVRASAHAEKLHALVWDWAKQAPALAGSDAEHHRTRGAPPAPRYVLCERYDQPIPGDDEWLHDADGSWYRRVDERDFATEQEAQWALEERGLRLAVVQQWPPAEHPPRGRPAGRESAGASPDTASIWTRTGDGRWTPL